MYSPAFASGWQFHSIPEILNSYGLPTKVFVFVPFRADPGDGPSYGLYLFYEEKGIEINYAGDAEQLSIEAEYAYRACPRLEDMWSIHLFLYQPLKVSNVIETILPAESLSYLGEAPAVYESISWQQARGQSLHDFQTLFTTGSDTCFEFNTP